MEIGNLKGLIERINKEKEQHKDYPNFNKTNIDFAICWFESEVKNGQKNYTSSEIFELLKALKY